MTTVRTTISAALGTVTEAAGTITNVIGTIGDVTTMANRFVESALTDQKDRQVIHRKTFRDQLLRDSRMEVARSNKEVLDFTNESEVNKELYDQATNYLPDDIFG